MIIRNVFAYALTILTCSTALAGSAGRVNVFGFDRETTVFAFEVYEAHDATYGGCSSIYAIDLARDRWLPDTPVRFCVNDGDPVLPMTEIRSRARMMAEPFFIQNGPFDEGWVVAAAPLGQMSLDGLLLSWRMPYTGSLPHLSNKARTLRLISQPTRRTNDFDEDCMSYKLALDGEFIHDDAGRIPASRGCPLTYRLHEVRCTVGERVCVVLIAVFTRGFEGLDRHFIANPLFPR